MGRLRNLIPMLFSVVWISCSWWSGPKYEIIVEYDDLPFEYALVHSPRWTRDGSSIYFIAGGACEGAVFSYDLSTESIEQITPLREMYGQGLAVSHISDKIAYSSWYVTPENDTDFVIVHLSDLNGNPLDSFVMCGTWITHMRFSEVSDTLLYFTLEPTSYFTGSFFLRLNLNTGPPSETLSYWGFAFDLFPEDTAFLTMDTIYSLTSNSKREAGLGYYWSVCINPQDPHYAAIAWVSEPENPFLRLAHSIAVINMLDGLRFEITACPEDRRKKDYRGVHSLDFSPDGNSIVYLIDSYQESSSRQEIGLITNVFDE